jgi:two-component system, NtrC family, response regulator HydG
MNPKKLVQVVLMEGDRPVRILLERELPAGGKLALRLEDGAGTAARTSSQVPGAVQQDLELDTDPGEEPMRLVRASSAASESVVITRGALSLPGSVSKVFDEAHDFLTRPLRPSPGPEPGANGSAAGTLTAPRPLSGLPVAGDIVGESPTMRDVLSRVERIASGQASVLIQGETGTGKSLLARAIHQASRKARKPFVVVNCSAFQDQLLESELFGHEKGAFTGAFSAKPGLFETAHEGTIFLDEVAEMSSAMQAKLLQVLDDGQLRRLGSNRSKGVDVRVISASNKDLAAEVGAGRFREDLLYRLKVITLTVPPLRERGEDIPHLVDYFLARFAQPGYPPKRISPAALCLLVEHHWPGNVRELANVLEGLALLVPEEEIGPQDLPPALRAARDFRLTGADTPMPLAEIERLHILRALRFTDGKKAPAARLLGIDVKTLASKLQGYTIES